MILQVTIREVAVIDGTDGTPTPGMHLRSRGAATACSRGWSKPTEYEINLQYSREAATAPSRGRQPTDDDRVVRHSREVATEKGGALRLSSLRGSWTLVHPPPQISAVATTGLALDPQLSSRCTRRLNNPNRTSQFFR